MLRCKERLLNVLIKLTFLSIHDLRNNPAYSCAKSSGKNVVLRIPLVALHAQETAAYGDIFRNNDCQILDNLIERFERDDDQKGDKIAPNTIDLKSFRNKFTQGEVKCYPKEKMNYPIVMVPA